MPRCDGTGPRGAGPLTGRGAGPCAEGKTGRAFGYGAGLGLGLVGLGLACRRGFGRGRGPGRGFGRALPFGGALSEEETKELLKQEKAALENRLKALDDELENI